MKIYTLALCFSLSICVAFSQTTLTLNDAIKIAQEKGLQSKINNNTYEIANQTYRLQQAGFHNLKISKINFIFEI